MLSPAVIAAIRTLDEVGIRVRASDVEAAEVMVKVECINTPQGKPYKGIVRGHMVEARKGDTLTVPRRVAEALIAHKGKCFKMSSLPKANRDDTK